jgi:HEAT repeat protein
MTTTRFPRVLLALTAALAFIWFATAAPAAAQDAKALAAAADAVLYQFPARSPQQRDHLAAAMLTLGEPGLAEYTRRLLPTGAGNDVAVRWAINAMAVFAAQSGNEARRALAERSLVAALGTAADVEVRTFLLAQLRIVGRDAAVTAAAPLLAEPAMVEPAAQLMLAIRGKAAAAALAAALPKAAAPGRVTIVKALGELGAAGSDKAIMPFAGDADPALRKVSLAALARLASPAAYATMTGAAKAAGFKYEPTEAVGALLAYARYLGKAGHAAVAERACRFVMQHTGAPDLLPTKAAALAILADVRGPAALPDLLAAAGDADSAYRNAALRAAERARGPFPATAWITKARGAQPAARADIIAMLGRTGHRQAVPFFRASLAAAEADVVIAAAEALAHVERTKAVADLVPLLASANTDIATRAAGILLWTADEKSLDPLAAMLDTLAPPAKAAAIGVIGARGGKRFAPRIFAFVSDAAPEIRAAAVGALAGVASPGDLPALFTMLDAAAADGVAPLQRAIVAAAIQITPETGRAAPIVQALKTAAKPDRLVEVLPQVGGPQALAAVIAEFESPAEDRRAAALRALTRWPGTEATDKLFAIFASGDAASRNTAFAAYVRQVASSPWTPEQKLPALKKALDKSSTVGDRRILLRAFERIKTMESFALVAPMLDDPDLGNEAAGAAMRIALPTSPGVDDGLTGAAVRAALTKAAGVLKGPQADADKDSIRAYLAVMK